MLRRVLSACEARPNVSTYAPGLYTNARIAGRSLLLTATPFTLAAAAATRAARAKRQPSLKARRVRASSSGARRLGGTPAPSRRPSATRAAKGSRRKSAGADKQANADAEPYNPSAAMDEAPATAHSVSATASQATPCNDPRDLESPVQRDANVVYAIKAPSALRTTTQSSRRIVPPVYEMPFPQGRFSTYHPDDQAAESFAFDPAAATPLRDAYQRDGSRAIWRTMRGEGTSQDGASPVVTATADRPPEWFESLCRDLFFRTEDGKKLPTHEAAASPTDGASCGDPTDPMLVVDFALRDETAYTVGPYAFPDTMASIWGEDRDTAIRLCSGDVNREYVCFAEGYRFPDRRQLPTSEGTEPLRLYVDPVAAARSADPTVYIQLSSEFPPAMWLPVRARAGAIRRVVSEFSASASAHCALYHEHFRWRWHRAERHLVQQNMARAPSDVLRMMGHLAGEVTFGETPIHEFSNSQEFFLGEFDDPERLVEHFDLSPYLFAIPLMRTRVDVHNPQYVPRIDGPGLALSLYRCVFSKALLLVQVHLSCEVKLPPQDPEAFHFIWKDAQQLPQSRIPVFVRVVWPDNERMCGGGNLLRRFNEWFSTEFSPDMPVDAAMALFTTQRWARKLGSELKGVVGVRQRLEELEGAAGRPQPPLLYPSTREIPNPEYTADERVAMHIQYLAHLGDPEIRAHIDRIRETCDCAAVRMGCAKAALEIGDRELFRLLVSSEPPGRMQTYMTKLVRKRKSRDLIDAEPRLLDDQYEFPAPLWTNRKGRLDASITEGALLTQRLK